MVNAVRFFCVGREVSQCVRGCVLYRLLVGRRSLSLAWARIEHRGVRLCVVVDTRKGVD